VIEKTDMRNQKVWSDREYDLWKYQFDQILAGVQFSGKSVRSFSIYLLLFVAFTVLVVFSDILGATTKLPVVGFELNKWLAGISGGVFITICMLGFSISRAYHKIRLHALINHLRACFSGVPENHILSFKPEDFAQLVIEPSIYNFVDNIEKPLSINVISTILQIIWIVAVPFTQGYIFYEIHKHYSGNLAVDVFLSILLTITVFSLFVISVVNVERIDWGTWSEKGAFD
jgi:hypothetical protein